MRTIIFIREGITPRLFNEAYALKQTGKYKLVLLCKTFDKYNMNIFNTVFDEIHPFQFMIKQNIHDSFPVYLAKFVASRHLIQPILNHLSDWKNLPTILKELDADLFNCCGTELTTEQAIKYTNCPVIMDLCNGTSAIGIENLSKERYERDKYCFENISGIIYRGSKFEIDYYINHGYKITCPSVVYADYCNKKFFVDNNEKLSSEDGEIHVVDMGGGFSSPKIFLTLNKFIKQKIHFHLYLAPHVRISPFIFKRHVKLNKDEKYFHLEEPVPFDEIHNEISKYDFGSVVYTSEFLEQHYSEYLKIATTYRLFTYLEGGLPVLVSDGYQLIKKTVVENKVGFSVRDKDLRVLLNIINRHNYGELRKNVFRAREKLLIDNYAERLINFYDSIG